MDEDYPLWPEFRTWEKQTTNYGGITKMMVFIESVGKDGVLYRWANPARQDETEAVADQLYRELSSMMGRIRGGR